MKLTIWMPAVLSVALVLGNAALPAADGPANLEIFAKDNLVAWCIVPFDAKKRGPSARAEMLGRLGH